MSKKLYKSDGVVIFDTSSNCYYCGFMWHTDLSRAEVFCDEKSLRNKLKFFNTHKDYCDKHKVVAQSLVLRTVTIKAKEQYDTVDNLIKEVLLC